MRHDGYCAVHPPVARAINIAVKTLQDLGHQVIDWKPTVSHSHLNEICGKCWTFDGGADCKRDFDLSGESPDPIIMYEPSAPQASAMEIMATNISKREAQKEYMEYWNSTSSLTNTGRPVDAIISPLAPYTAAVPGGYTYYGYSTWVNVLDYTSVTVPVTEVDKSVDGKLADFKPLNETDKKTQDTYDPEIYHGAPVAVQFVGRRLQEEKMLALAGLFGDAVNA